MAVKQSDSQSYADRMRAGRKPLSMWIDPETQRALTRLMSWREEPYSVIVASLIREASARGRKSNVKGGA
jgi:hypothetical protein